MKKLLTTIFMAVLAVSAFATVNVETETPTVYHDGVCERVGSMRFIVTNDQDYASATTTDPITIEIRLTDGAVLCHDLDGTDDANNYWVALEVDGTFWDNTGAPEVLARGAAGSNYIEVILRAAPRDGSGNAPNPTFQAWFRLGSTVLIDGTAFNPALYDATFVNQGTKNDGTPICVNYTGRVNGVDAFMENEFNVISLTTWLGGLGGTQLGVSYSPANPAIAYGGPQTAHNLIVDSDCGKNDPDLISDDVLLCQCYHEYTVGTGQNTQTLYDCYDLYRVGTLVLDTDTCDVWVEEDQIGMLPAGSVITMTIVDSAGNPLSTVAETDGVYLTSASLTPMDGTGLTLTMNAATAIDPGDGVGAGEWANVNGSLADDLSDANNLNGYVPTDGVCDTSGKDTCVDNYDLFSSLSWTVNTESATAPERIQVGNVGMARYTAAGPITAYVKLSWSPYPCGAGGSVILPYPLNFVECPPEEITEPEYFPAYEYFTFFPKFSDGYWWTGLAVTNVTWFNENFVGGAPGVTDQDADLVYYMIEADGDVYMLDAGTLPKSGITVTLLSDSALAPTYLGSNQGEVAFGDEPFWVVVEATPTMPSTHLAIDGFGMIGNGNEGQGTLPRTDAPYVWYFGGNLFNK